MDKNIYTFTPSWLNYSMVGGALRTYRNTTYDFSGTVRSGVIQYPERQVGGFRPTL
ncbi:MAG: hypothetical protein GDA48_00990 [Hormoscilla sp. GM102CHS1]|nr:hypothetical protein [Hormoscilla sp. GM102CHS1]